MVVMVMMVVVAAVAVTGGGFWDLYACADAYIWCLDWCSDWIMGFSVPTCQRILLIAECELRKEIADREDFITGILCLSVVTESHVGCCSVLV
jgi:hypothetical protein